LGNTHRHIKGAVLAALFLLLYSLPGVVFAQEVFTVEKLPDIVNSPYEEITPVPNRAGNVLFFTRVGYPDFDRTLFLDTVDWAKKLKPEPYRNFLAAVYSEIAGYSVSNPERSKFNQDVWMAVGDSAHFTAVEHPGPPLNNALPNSIAAITPDPNAYYCINQFKKEGDMNKGFSVIHYRPDSLLWQFPEPVEIDEYYTITSEVNLTMSFDGKILIISATRYDSRDMDLYVCFRQGEKHWSAPQNLGTVINSPKRETTPFLSEDHTTLFFSSNRAGGNNDLYVSKRLDDTWKNWSSPVRLVEPINSDADDAQPYFNMSSGYLYFTSRRDGNSDIFRTRLAPPQPTELLVKGRVINRKTNETVPNARIRYGAKDEPTNIIASDNGFYELTIPKGLPFELMPQKAGFTGAITSVIFRRDYYYFREQYVDVYLDPLEIDTKIELRPIYFAQSKPDILPTSYAELERLIGILQDNPGVSIAVEGHTDNLGQPQDLIRLSEVRAQAIRDYLVKAGIGEDRIIAKGLGHTVPLNDNSTEELRSQNRRVEVRVTKIVRE
jgi:outer membrane protein OmpA-like peptidoglycan-associated protein